MAQEIHSPAPGNRPMRSKAMRGGTATAPSPARGMGMSSGTASTGAFHSSASAPSSPPWVTARTRAPASRASWTAVTVSSVLPENDTATTRVDSSMNDGAS